MRKYNNSGNNDNNNNRNYYTFGFVISQFRSIIIVLTVNWFILNIFVYFFNTLKFLFFIIRFGGVKTAPKFLKSKKMCKYSDFGVNFYRTANKKQPTTHELTDSVKTINSIIFPILKGFAFPMRTQRVIKQLTAIGVNVKNTPTPKAENKKNEILSYLRETIIKLRGVNCCPTIQEAQQTINFQLSASIRAKNENADNADELIKVLKTNKQLKDDLGEYFNQCNTTQFQKVQNEIIAIITEKYEI